LVVEFVTEEELVLNNVGLKGLRVAITGGTSGLGLALVRNLAAGHARVAFVARRAQLVERVSREAGACGIVGDVGLKEDVHVLINNTSSLGPTPLKLLADTECEELQKALAVNVLGPFRLTKALFGALAVSAREGRGAVVINISSDAAVNAYSGWGAYGAAKAALNQMTAIWAEETIDEGVRFLSLDPGDMDTTLHALAVPDADPATLKRPEDAAQEVVASMLGALRENASLALTPRA
jgi:NAD(P)-dependent dehydrogenase (short-subunit alcohol dehydrogenase family)